MTKDQVDEALFAFLQAIYKFEKMEFDKFSISWQEMLLLKHLLTKTELSMGAATEILNIKPFQTTRLVDGLVKKQMLLRFEKASDRRIRFIQITEKGEAILAEADSLHYMVIKKASENLGIEQIDSILDMMFHLENLLGISEN